MGQAAAIGLRGHDGTAACECCGRDSCSATVRGRSLCQACCVGPGALSSKACRGDWTEGVAGPRYSSVHRQVCGIHQTHTYTVNVLEHLHSIPVVTVVGVCSCEPLGSRITGMVKRVTRRAQRKNPAMQLAGFVDLPHAPRFQPVKGQPVDARQLSVITTNQMTSPRAHGRRCPPLTVSFWAISRFWAGSIRHCDADFCQPLISAWKHDRLGVGRRCEQCA